jgi:hypothetical protein
MKSDAFTLTVVFAIVVSVVASGIVIVITQNDSTIIPTVERGKITSKNTINANDSVIELLGGQTLHTSNITLYMSLQENQSYVFNCLFNHNTKIVTIQTVQNDTTT